MRLAKILCFLSLVIMVGAMLVNCSSSDDTSTTEPTPIQTEPDFIGDIIEVHSIGGNDVLGTILVEGTDVIQSSDKYVVTVKMETLILEQDGKIVNRISFADLESGQQVRIWFSGPVAESYPAQVDAAQIMMVRNEPTSQQTEPDFTGDIIEVHLIGENNVLGTILVEGTDIIQSSDKYVVTIKEDTIILQQDGEIVDNISFNQLEVGQKVQIWFFGPVRESYPAQVDAAQVIITNNQNDDEINLGDEFQMSIGQKIEFSDVSLDIVFKGVVGDSRCAQDVTCVWQGEVSVDIEVIGGDGSHLMTLTQPGLFYDYSKDSYAGYEIAFKVLPYPDAERQIEDDEYQLVMILTREASRMTGILKGHVTIGPIEPVVQAGDDPEDVPPEVYDARKIMVFDMSGEELIEQVGIGHDGNYSVELASGTYLIDINRLGIDYSDQVPIELEILAGEMVHLDIDIDTGIR
ncbi:DUF3221 domain-containing protein [Chloroflexota bacterium]